MKKRMTMIAAVATAFGLCTSTFADTQTNWFSENAQSVERAMTQDGETSDGVWSNLTDQVEIGIGKVAVDADDETPVAYRPKMALRGDSASIILGDITFTAARKTLPALDAGIQAAVAITTNDEGKCVFAVANGGVWEVTTQRASIDGIHKVKVDFHYGEANTVDYSLDQAGQWAVLKTGALNPATVKVSTVEFAGNGSFSEMSGKRALANVDVTVTPVEGALVTTVKDAGGNEITPAGNVYSIPEGAYTVTYTAAEGYILTPKTIGHNTSEGASIDDGKDVKPQLIVVTVAYDGDDPVPYADEMMAFAAIAEYTQTPGKTADVEFKQGATNLVAGYAFDMGVTISIYDDYDSEDPEEPLNSFWDIAGGNVTFTKGLENNKRVYFDAGEDEEGNPIHKLIFGGVMKAGSHLIVDDLAAYAESITLDPTDCSVAIEGDWTDPSLSYREVFAEVGGYELNEEYVGDEESPLDGYTVYSLVKAADYVASVSVQDGEAVPYATVEEALQAVQAHETACLFPIVVTALAEDGLTITDAGRTAKIAKGVSITITNEKTSRHWTVSGTLGYAGVIDGWVIADNIEKIDDADITLGKDAVVAVLPASGIDATFFKSGVDGRVVRMAEYDYRYFDVVAECTVTVNIEEGITAVVTNKTQGGEAKVLTASGSFKVYQYDDVSVAYTCSVPGYRPEPAFDGGMVAGDPIYVSWKEAIRYTITYMHGDKALTTLEPDYYTVEAAATLPTDLGIDGVTLDGWYDNAKFEGFPVTAIPVGSTGDRTFYAKTTSVVDPVAKVIDEKVDGFDQLTSDQQKAARTNVQTLNEICGGSAEAAESWIKNIYGDDAKIPAEKLAATTADLIAISVEYNLPVLGETPTVAFTAGTTANAFEFKLMDGDDAVPLAQAHVMAKFQNMVEFTAELGTTPFAKSTETDVVVMIKPEADNCTAVATFTKATDAGFMRVNLKVPEKGE